MINLSTDNPLRILLPNNNKALAEAIKQATPQQLELMKEHKDIKGVLTALADQAAQSSKSNGVLLEIIKNSPAFEKLGNFPDDLKTLQQILKKDPALAPLAEKLEPLLARTEQLPTAQNLKRQTADSGVFLESKLAASAVPKAELKALLGDLDRLLQRSELPVAKNAHRHIAALLSHEIVANPDVTDRASMQRLSDALAQVLRPLQTTLSKGDIVYGKEMTQLLEKLQRFLPQTALHADPGSAKVATAAVQQPLKNPDAQQAPNAAAATAPTNPTITSDTPKNERPLLAPPLKELLDSPWVKSELRHPRYALTEPLKQELLKQPEIFIVQTLKEVLASTHTALLQSTLPESKGLLGLLEKIFGAIELKTAEAFAAGDTAQKSLRSLELLGDPKITKEIKLLTEHLQKAVQNGDALFTREAAPLLKDLAHFTQPQHLQPSRIGENLAHDAKSLLLHLQQEVQNAPTTGTQEILRQVDKLMLQIDYHQLYSYLSNSATIYFPYRWEMLEEGSVSFKKGESKRFFCHINLQLKEFGTLNLMLALYNGKEIEIQGYAESETLRALIQENMQTLRAAMRDAGLVPGTIRISDISAATAAGDAYDGDGGHLEMGFEVKI